MVCRCPTGEHQAQYELTEFGLSAADPLRYLRNWVEENLDRLPASGS